MEKSEMRTLLDKILLVAKLEGLGSITEDKWDHIQQCYQIKFGWNAVLEAKNVLIDRKKLSTYFQSQQANEIFDFWGCSQNNLRTQSQNDNEIYKADLSSSNCSNTPSAELEVEELFDQASPNAKIIVQDYPLTSTSASTQLDLRRGLQKFKRFKSIPVPTWENNLPASSSSSKTFGCLHLKRNLTITEWGTLLGYANRKGMLPFILGVDFWEDLKSSVKTKVPISKPASELKVEFFTNVVPNRRSYPQNIIPKLNLRPSDIESLLTVFHEIKNSDSVTNPIQILVTDSVLSDMIDWEGWFHVFIEALFTKSDSFWMASALEIKRVKELYVKYFFERVAPKLATSALFNRLIQDAISEIALNLKTESQYSSSVDG